MRFIDILADHGVAYATEGDHHCRPGWIQMACPFCGKGTGKFHMGYSLEKNYVSCWKCGHHRLTETLAELTGLDFKKCRTLLDSVDKIKFESVDVRGKLELPKGLGPLLPKHRAYLRSRDYDPDEIERVWDVKGIGLASKLSWRVFIPIKLGNDTVSWTTRAVTSAATLRYVSASAKQEAVNHKTLLYGENLVKHAICVVEGPLDVWKIGPGCVGTCGTGYTTAQVERMSRYPVIGICFDNEAAAQKRARALVDQLSAFGGSVYNIQLDSKDAGEATPKELRQVRKCLGL